MTEIPNGFYRVSVKALIWENERREKFAVVLEDNGWWELPGGGMDFGETPEECLKRELLEETGLKTTWMADKPGYLLRGKNMSDYWAIGLVYEVKTADFNFIKSRECLEMKFISLKDVDSINTFRTVRELAKQLEEDKNK